MSAKRWQKELPHIQITSVAVLTLVSLVVTQLSWPYAVKSTLLPLVWMIGVVLVVLINNRFANSLIRIFRFPDDVAISIVNQVLNEKYIRFQRRSDKENVRYLLADKGLTLTIEPYPLYNWAVDGQPVNMPAAKVELHGINSSNQRFVVMLTEAINEMANVRVLNRHPKSSQSD